MLILFYSKTDSLHFLHLLVSFPVLVSKNQQGYSALYPWIYSRLLYLLINSLKSDHIKMFLGICLYSYPCFTSFAKEIWNAVSGKYGFLDIL